MHTIEMKKMGHRLYPFLYGKILVAEEKLRIKFDDGHLQDGEVIIDFDRLGNETPFIAVNFHHKKPWVNIVGMKAKRIK